MAGDGWFDLGLLYALKKFNFLARTGERFAKRALLTDWVHEKVGACCSNVS